ncbi:MAG: GIY-YIG nuclease family protein [Pseudomonadota bacterium]
MGAKFTDMIHENNWHVYIVRCSDGTLYTGVTTNLARRISEHNSPRGGARYTRARQPVELVYAESGASRSAVCSREYEIKKLSLAEKTHLIHALKKGAR